MMPSTPPKGSLEDLFRHHLLESEAAAVRPRPQVWEQIDNSLLLAENEKYRRRLLAYRWAVAASLLLASLAGGGWWQSQQRPAATAPLAQATQVASPLGLATARRTAPAPAVLASAALSTVSSSSIDQTATLSAPARTEVSLASTSLAYTSTAGAAHRQQASAHSHALEQRRLVPEAGQVGKFTELASAYQSAAGADQPVAGSILASPQQAAPSALALASSEAAAAALPGEATQAAGEVSSALSLSASGATLPGSEATLATRWASLMPGTASLPTSLPEVALAPGPPLELARNWQYGLSYSASAYQPNIDWTQPVVAYNSALGINSASITRSAAAEYRTNLRAGLGQRLSVWAARRLGSSRWSLRTGLELAQNNATSASSVAFLGEQVADLSYTQASAHPLQRTAYRYRSVSVPAELRYANPLKTGFSFYGRVGAFVSALLNVHSEVEGNPEASRTYSLTSASTPYRRVSTGLRGAAGMQYRPAGHQWALNFGPVAELGILSLNADPSQDFLTQQRPYSFGLEAGMELGRGFKIQ